MDYRQVLLESRECPLGCQRQDAFVLVGRDRLFNLPGAFTVIRCQRCGLLRTDPRPTAESIGFYYPDNYGPYQNANVNLDQPKKSLWKRLLKSVLELNIERVPELRPGRMLEIGCASGSYLERMAQKGWQVQGIEFSDKAGGAARSIGYAVHIGALENAPDPEKKYDLIVGWMVLEHLHDPVAALRKLRSWINPGGWLILSVPNTASIGFSVFQADWFHLHLPNHLYHYSAKTLREVLKEGGWSAEKIFYHRVIHDLVASLGYRLEGRNLLPGLAASLSTFPQWEGKLYVVLYPFAYLLSLLRRTGGMTVWNRPCSP